MKICDWNKQKKGRAISDSYLSFYREQHAVPDPAEVIQSSWCWLAEFVVNLNVVGTIMSTKSDRVILGVHETSSQNLHWAILEDSPHRGVNNIMFWNRLLQMSAQGRQIPEKQSFPGVTNYQNNWFRGTWSQETPIKLYNRIWVSRNLKLYSYNYSCFWYSQYHHSPKFHNCI